MANSRPLRTYDGGESAVVTSRGHNENGLQLPRPQQSVIEISAAAEGTRRDVQASAHSLVAALYKLAQASDDSMGLGYHKASLDVHSAICLTMMAGERLRICYWSCFFHGLHLHDPWGPILAAVLTMFSFCCRACH